MDKPVTFHARVSSSGYGKPPVMKLHAGGPSTRQAAAARAANAAPLRRGSPLQRRYTSAEQPMVVPQQANNAGAPPLGVAAMRVAYAPDASRIALAGADGAVSLLRLPARRQAGGPSPALVGHSGAVNSLHFSHSGRLMLTAAADASAGLWDVSHDKPPSTPLLRMQHARHSPGMLPPDQKALSAAAGSANPPFSGEVRQASFYYLDQLILLACGSGLHLYSYSLQRTPAHDAIRAAELRHRYQLHHRWEIPRAQVVTCFAASNSFLSPIALVAGSDRHTRSPMRLNYPRHDAPPSVAGAYTQSILARVSACFQSRMPTSGPSTCSSSLKDHPMPTPRSPDTNSSSPPLSMARSSCGTSAPPAARAALAPTPIGCMRWGRASRPVFGTSAVDPRISRRTSMIRAAAGWSQSWGGTPTR